MQLHTKFEDLDIANAVVTMGMFDGVHTAHQKILNSVITSAKKNNGQSVVISFWPHPRMVLQPENHNVKLLSTLNEKIKLLSDLGIDHLFIMPFTINFSKWSAEKFVQQVLLDKLKTTKFVIGYDHHFGNNREGNLPFLTQNAKRFGFEIEEIHQQLIDDATINSTSIRQALSQGECEVATKLLGRPYSITGKVVSGNQLGRTIGFPTANILIEEDYKLVPQNGVYAVKVEIGGREGAEEKLEVRREKLEERGEGLEVRDTQLVQSDLKEIEKFGGMLNIGIRPTFDGTKFSIEVNIFDFSSDIYGHDITVHFIAKLRDEKKFEGIDGLKTQLAADRKSSLLKL